MPWLMPILHPAAVVRGQYAKEPYSERALKRLLDWEREGNGPPAQPESSGEPPIGAVLFPSLSQLGQWSGRLNDYDGIAIDLETAGDFIICVGLTPWKWDGEMVGPTIVWRNLGQGGRQWWRPNELPQAARWLADILADTRLVKVMCFGQMHDVPILEKNGFVVGGRILNLETMIHTAYAEMSFGLQVNATFYCGAGAWKYLVHEGEDLKEGV